MRSAHEREGGERFEPQLSLSPRLPRELIRNFRFESRFDELVATRPLVWIRAGLGTGKRTAVAAWLQAGEGDRISRWLTLPDRAAENREAIPAILKAAVAATAERVSAQDQFPTAETLAYQRAWAIDLVRRQTRETVLVVDLNSQWLTTDEMTILTLFATECPLLRLVLIQDDVLRSVPIRDGGPSDITADDLMFEADGLRNELARHDLRPHERVIQELVDRYGGSPAVVSAFVTQASSQPSQDLEEALAWAQAKVLVDLAQLLMPGEGMTILTLLVLIPAVEEGYLATTVAGRRVDLELRVLRQRGLLEHSSMTEGEYLYSLRDEVREVVRSMTLAYYLGHRDHLHRAAAEYLVAVGELDSAVRQLQLLGDMTGALELFSTHWRTYLRLAGCQAAQDLCAEFAPSDVLANLEAMSAIWLIHSNSPEGIFGGAYASRIRAVDNTEMAALAARSRLTVKTALMLISLERDGIELAKTVAAGAFVDIEDLLAEPGVATRELYLEYLLAVGAVSLADGALQPSAQRFEEALALSETMSDSRSAHLALTGLALSLTMNGELSAGQDLIERATRLGKELGMNSSPSAAELFWCQSLIWIYRDDHVEVDAIIAANKTRGDTHDARAKVLRFLEAQSLFRSKQYAAAAGILRKLLASITTSSALPLFRQSAVWLLSNILVASRQPGAALQLLDRELPNVGHAPCFASVRGLAHVARGDPRTAITVTDPCLEHSHQHAGSSLIHVYITRAAAFEAMNLPISAEDAFSAGLGIAADSGARLNVGIFVGEQLVDVHRRVRQKAPQLGTGTLFAYEHKAVQSRQKSHVTIDLTSKERDVLNHLTSSLSLAEMAAVLFISKNTLKTHVRNIYSKLGVTSRAEAVDIATTWGEGRSARAR